MIPAIVILLIVCCVTHLYVRNFIKLRAGSRELRATHYSRLTSHVSRFTIIVFVFSFSSNTFSQQVPLDVLIQNRYNEITMDADTSLFTGFRSINWLEVKPFLNNKKSEIIDSTFGLSTTSGSYAFKHLGNDNWIQTSNGKSTFTIDPYVVATAGAQNHAAEHAIYQLVGGIRLQETINDKFSFSLGFASGYSKFPSYINSTIDSNRGYIPGFAKGTLTSNGGYTATQVTGNITYIPSKYFLIAAGYGKNFIGDGYRSLIFSDNSSNNPYIRLQARVWKLTYNVIYNKMSNPRYQVDGHNQRKYSVMHYLGINFSKKFQLGLYDNVIWYQKDSSAGERGFDVQYLNPLIFLRPIEFEIGSPDNAFIGITYKYKFYKQGFLYGQIGLDDLNLTTSLDHHSQHFGNKYGLQLGIFNKDLFHVKDLSWRFEWNGVRPYMYGHGFGKIGLNYTNNNQSIADPFNANFHEFISIFQYHNQRWYGMLENLFAIRGENPGLPYNNGEDLWGGEVGVPTFGSKTLQGDKHKYFYNQLSLGYLLNPRNGLSIQGDAMYRHHSAPGISSNNIFFQIGIQTRLFNYYHDL